MASTAELNELLDPLDLFGGQANRLASDIQGELADIGLQLERDFFNQLREDEAPVREARNQALGFLQQVQQGEAQLPSDPALPFQQQNALRDIRRAAAARGKFFSGGRLEAEQDALAQLQSRDTSSQLNRLLNLAGFQTQDLLGSNQLIAQNTDAQVNQLQNIGAIRQAGNIGQSNALLNLFDQGAGVFGDSVGLNRQAGQLVNQRGG